MIRTRSRGRLTWWNDPRLAAERRNAFIISAIIATAAAGIGTMFVIKHTQEQKNPVIASTTSHPAQPIPQWQSVTPFQTVENGWLDSTTIDIKRGNYEEAKRRLDAAEVEVSRMRGVVSHRTGDLEMAEKCFLRALELNNKSVPDKINLASVYQLQGKHEEAIALFEESFNLEPQNNYAAGRYYLGLMHAGQSDRAQREIIQTLEISPIHSLPNVGIPAAAIELQAGNSSKAAEFLGAVRGLLSRDLFNSLMSEPPLVDHAANPAVARFFSETSAQR
ncbi:MAG: tetratricopeptide repeat protein [Terrimicrobiaceae bacterium]